MLIGRSAERLQLLDLLDRARQGKSGALVIIGEPGVGKTALLDFCVSRADAFRVLRARGRESEAELPFAGLTDLLRPITRYVRALPAPQATALSGAFGFGPHGPHVPPDPYAIFLGTLGLLAAAAEREPVLAVIDDAHWLDPSSQNAVLFAARRIQAEGIALLISARSAHASAFANADLPVLVLRGLEPSDAARLVKRKTRTPVAAEVAARLAIAADGNPLALIEMSRDLSAAQLIGTEELPDPLPIGKDLRQLFLSRLAQLPAETRRALLVASASDSAETAELGAALTSMKLRLSRLEPAETAGILTIGQNFEFTHPLVRAAIYHDATPQSRRAAHRALASIITGGEAAARRAWHLAAATLGTDEGVAAQVETAADDARARGAHAVAAAAFERAADLSSVVPGRIARQMAAAGEHVLAGQARQALPLLDDARHRTADEVTRADIDHFRGRVLMITGPLVRAREVLADAAHVVELSAPLKAASMLSDAGLASFIAGEIGIGEALSRKAVILTGGRDDEPGEINHLLFTGMLVLRGRLREAEPHLARERQRIQAMRPGDPPQLLMLSGISLMWAEELDLARTILEGVTADARRQAAVGLLPLALAQRAELAWRTGDWAVAYAHATEATKLAADTGQTVDLSYALAIQTLVLASLGREVECRASATAAIEAAQPIGAESTVSRVEAALGLLELGAGRPNDAAHHLRTAHELVQGQGVREPTVVPYLGDLIESLLRAGRGIEAEDTINQMEIADAGEMRQWTHGVLARVRGMTAPEDGYVIPFQKALEWHQRLPGRFERARTLLAFGERLRRSGQRLRARDHLREALYDFERLGAGGWSTRTLAELRAAGETTTVGPPPALGELTPQELQVALAVASGLTNREVAAALFLSPKTIEYHLSNVYSKLALRSRSQLVRVVAAQA
jgi:DNA-binding CsgD family transcriptional regulator